MDLFKLRGAVFFRIGSLLIDMKGLPEPIDEPSEPVEDPLQE